MCSCYLAALNQMMRYMLSLYYLYTLRVVAPSFAHAWYYKRYAVVA